MTRKEFIKEVQGSQLKAIAVMFEDIQDLRRVAERQEKLLIEIRDKP